MKFTCPDCGQHLECETLAAGRQVPCPACGASLEVPQNAPKKEWRVEVSDGDSRRLSGDLKEIAPEQPSATPDSSEAELVSLRHTLQSNIDRAALTISQFMAQRSIEGGVQLDESGTPSTASDVLTAEQGRKYKLGGVVAKGGMGAIIDARDANLRRHVAMKVILEPDDAGKEQVLRFIEEAQVTSQLEHPGIVPVHELGVDAGGNVFYTMKFVRGVSMKEILTDIREGDQRTVGEYPLARLLTVFQRVCDAVAFAHSKHVIHRDLKPENVMVGEYGEVLVMDWGLAKLLPRRRKKLYQFGAKKQEQEESEPGPGPAPEPDEPGTIDSLRKDEIGATLKTVTGMIMGTPGFMAPEQATGEVEKLDERTDIYALGAILYDILTLQPPVTGKNMDEILKKVTTGEIRHPSAFNAERGMRNAERRRGTQESKSGEHSAPPAANRGLPHCPGGLIPDSLAAVAMKALALKPAERYQSVKDLQKDIDAYQSGFATSAEQAGAWKLVKLFVKRHKAMSIAACIIAGLLVGGLTINIRERIRAEQARDVAEQSRAVAQKALSDLAGMAPVVSERAAGFLEKQELDNALETISCAVTLAPENAEYHLRKGHILQAMLRLAEAAACYEQALKLEPGLDAASKNRDVCRKFIKANPAPGEMAAASLHEFYAELVAQDRYPEARAIARGISGHATVLSSEAVIKEALAKAGLPAKVARGPDGTLTLSVGGPEVRDLSPLKGLSLTSLNLSRCSATDLSPLKGMPLRNLDLPGCITNIGPLRGMALRSLSLSCYGGCRDLSPLHGMPLETLRLDTHGVTDLSPLNGMPLTSLGLHYAGGISDLSPLKGMPLKTFGIGEGHSLSDLSPLKGMPLTSLSLHQCVKLTDLSPLKGMPLTSLGLAGANVNDLSPLKGMPLTSLNLHCCVKASDLSPLKGMPLASLNLYGCAKLTDLRPLLDCPKLASLSLPRPDFRDIEFLRNKPGLLHLGSKNLQEQLPVKDFWERFDREKNQPPK